MDSRDRQHLPDDDAGMSMGGISLGLLGGGVIGFVAACVAAAMRRADLFAYLVFGGAALGGFVGFVQALAGVAVGEAAAHLVAGLLSGIAEYWPSYQSELPLWLRVVFWVGLVLGVVLLFRHRLL